jgi:hypothetical protein
MYNYAFFSRILAILAFILIFLCAAVSVQHFRLRNRVTQTQASIQNAYRANMSMNTLIPELIRYGQRDPSIFQLLQKYGIAPAPQPAGPPPGAKAAPAPKSKRK